MLVVSQECEVWMGDGIDWLPDINESRPVFLPSKALAFKAIAWRERCHH